MAIIEENALKSHLKGVLAPVYMLFGDDDYLIKLYERKISETAVSENADFNLHVFDGAASMQRVYDAATQLPMMSSRSCVLLRDFDLSKSNQQEFTKLLSLISEGFDTTVLLLTFSPKTIDEKKSDKAKKLIAAVQKAGGIVSRLGFRAPADLVKLLCGSAAKRGCNMDNSTARYLIESVGQDINTLYSEMEKLVGYAITREKQITKKEVDLICVKTVEASVYQIQNELLSGNAQKALEIIGRLFDNKVEAQIIFSAMASAYNELFLARASLKAKLSSETVAQDFGYGNRKFVIDRAQTNARRLSPKQISQSLQVLTACDKAQKTGASSGQGRFAIEKLAVQLAGIVNGGGRL